MMRLFLAAGLIYSQGSIAHSNQQWMGTWRSQKLLCPFGCSQNMRDFFEKSKSKKFQFTVDTIVDASGMSEDCLKPSKPDYSGLKLVKAEEYLLEWSQNEQANETPNVKTKLPKLLGLNPNKKVTAGVVHCIDAKGDHTASVQNIIFVDAKRAFARFEENAYWELSR